MDHNDNPPSTSTSAATTVIDAKINENKTEIFRLKKQRELFLNTKVYNENDEIVKMIDAKILNLSNWIFLNESTYMYLLFSYYSILILIHNFSTQKL